MERNIKLLAIFNFFTDFKFYSAVLILYFAKITGSYTLAMSLFSVAMVSAALFEVPTGVLSDRVGRKRTITLGSVSAILSVVCYAVGGGYAWLFIGALFEGLGYSFYSGNNDALLHDSLRDLKKAHTFDHYLGKVSAMFQAALTIGAVLGGVIAYFSYAWVMWLSVVPQIICLIISLFITEPSSNSQKTTNIYSHLKDSIRTIWHNKNLRLLTANDILGFGIGESAFQFKSAFIATLWPTWAIGIAKTLSFIGGGISFWYAGKLIKKFKGINLMLFETIINRIINTVSLVFPTIASPAIMSSTSFLYGATEVASKSLMQAEFTDSERATLASIVSFGGNIVFGIFSIVLGFVADRYSPGGALLFTQVISLPAIVILFTLKKQLKS
jgi:MFS family permease